MEKKTKCKHYREEGVGADLGWESGCTCNNPIDMVGECIYGDGVIRGKPVCRYYEEFNYDESSEPETSDKIAINTQDEDKFYLEYKTGKVTWIYYNPDSDAGGQYVYNVFYHYTILRMMNLAKDAENFFDLLGSCVKQYLYDIDTEDFDSMDNHFNNEPYDLLGCTDETMKKIIEFAEMIEKREQDKL